MLHHVHLFACFQVGLGWYLKFKASRMCTCRCVRMDCQRSSQLIPRPHEVILRQVRDVQKTIICFLAVIDLQARLTTIETLERCEC
jgi:hypothetical protein